MITIQSIVSRSLHCVMKTVGGIRQLKFESINDKCECVLLCRLLSFRLCNKNIHIVAQHADTRSSTTFTIRLKLLTAVIGGTEHQQNNVHLAIYRIRIAFCGFSKSNEDKMKLLTYSFLTSKCIKGVKVGYPLKLNVSSMN